MKRRFDFIVSILHFLVGFSAGAARKAGFAAFSFAAGLSLPGLRGKLMDGTINFPDAEL
jgi:hypothetical protein